MCSFSLSENLIALQKIQFDLTLSTSTALPEEQAVGRTSPRGNTPRDSLRPSPPSTSPSDSPYAFPSSSSSSSHHPVSNIVLVNQGHSPRGGAAKDSPRRDSPRTHLTGSNREIPHPTLLTPATPALSDSHHARDSPNPLLVAAVGTHSPRKISLASSGSSIPLHPSPPSASPQDPHAHPPRNVEIIEQAHHTPGTSSSGNSPRKTPVRMMRNSPAIAPLRLSSREDPMSVSVSGGNSPRSSTSSSITPRSMSESQLARWNMEDEQVVDTMHSEKIKKKMREVQILARMGAHPNIVYGSPPIKVSLSLRLHLF